MCMSRRAGSTGSTRSAGYWTDALGLGEGSGDGLVMVTIGAIMW